ncbi:MAG: glycine cleavage system protein H [Actinomycetota bacterium]|jgi:glycine cleavage system H protein|nr:glycine cleavage system protein H [Actinomycetota bacterium]
MSERVWGGCVLPDDLLYDVERNVWVRLEGDEAVLGMTDVAQSLGGKLVQISFKPRGRRVARGKPLAVIESAKWVGPFPSPFTGEVLETNEAAFAADILVANRDPYGEGWLIRMRPANLAAERSALVTGAEAFERYRSIIDERGIRCFRCAE